MDVMTLAAKLTLTTSEFDSNLDKSEKKMKGLTSSGVAVGNVVAGAVSRAAKAAKDFAVDVVKVGMDFDTAMSQVKALGQLEDNDFRTLRKRAMELGASTKFTAAQVAEAFSYMALAGWDTNEMLSGIDGVLSLAAASGEDLGQTSDIVTDAITAMGLTAEDATHFVDVLAQASANSNTTVAQMGQAFKFLATTGGVMEYSIEDVATALGLLANNGIKATQAGTSMRQILSTLINPSKKAAKAMDSLGISLFDPKTNARKPLGQVLQEFRDVFKEAGLQLEEGFDADELQAKLDELNEWYDAEYEEIQKMDKGKNKALRDLDKEYDEKFLQSITPNRYFLGRLGDIGGLRGISSLFAIMNSTDEDFQQLTDSIYNSEGAADEMAKTMLDNLEGDITILNSAMEGLKIIVSDSFKEQLRSFVQTFTEQIGKMNEAFQSSGVLGMFVSLADWVINGITDALMDTDATGEQAASFGEAIGDFVGRTISKLITNAPELIKGLFTAGISLANGLIEGMFYGLTGTGEGTLAGVINTITDEEQDAIDQANTSAVQAKGILGYMDSLTEKYGDAAKNTEEWATAFGKLQEVYPKINEFIKTQGGELSTTNENLMAYIENTREMMIQDAKKAALQGVTDAYISKVQELGTAEIRQDMARGQAQEAWNALVSYVQKTDKTFTGKGMDIDQLMDLAYRTASELGESSDDVKNLGDIYKNQTSEADKMTSSITNLRTEAERLKTEMQIAEKALQNYASSLNSSSASTSMTYGQWKTQQYMNAASHAKGEWNVPYDDYLANLHRGEMVLTASQARRYREGSDNVDSSALFNSIVAAVREGMNNATVNTYIDGKNITDTVNRYNVRDLKSRRFT